MLIREFEKIMHGEPVIVTDEERSLPSEYLESSRLERYLWRPFKGKPLMTPSARRLLRCAWALFLGGAVLGGWRFGAGTGVESGVLVLSIRERDKATPARVAVLDESRKGWMADDALRIGSD